MKRATITMILAGLLMGSLHAEAKDTPLDEIISGVEGFYAEKASLQVTFRQVVRKKYQAPGVKGMERTGVAFFQKPGKMRWDYREPEPIYYVSNGEVLWVYEASENVAYKGQVKGSQLFGAMKFLFGSGDLRTDFDVVQGKGTESAHQLVLKSKTGDSAYRSIRLFVNKESFEIRKTVVEDPLGDRSEIVFEKIRYAPISNPEWFEWKPGPGVRVEDLSRRGN